MKPPHPRVKRIKKEIPIVSVLSSFGYQVRPDGGDREQQFPCDLHGDGRDNKPSARVYPETQSWYCFGCNLSRDAIETVRIKKNLSFPEALDWLESQYHLPPMPWDHPVGPPQERLEDQVGAGMNPPVTFETGRDRVKATLERTTSERSLPMDRILAYWEAYDFLVHEVGEGLDEKTARVKIEELRHRLTKEILG